MTASAWRRGRHLFSDSHQGGSMQKGCITLHDCTLRQMGQQAWGFSVRFLDPSPAHLNHSLRRQCPGIYIVNNLSKRLLHTQALKTTEQRRQAYRQGLRNSQKHCQALKWFQGSCLLLSCPQLLLLIFNLEGLQSNIVRELMAEATRFAVVWMFCVFPLYFIAA